MLESLFDSSESSPEPRPQRPTGQIQPRAIVSVLARKTKPKQKSKTKKTPTFKVLCISPKNIKFLPSLQKPWEGWFKLCPPASLTKQNLAKAGWRLPPSDGKLTPVHHGPHHSLMSPSQVSCVWPIIIVPACLIFFFFLSMQKYTARFCVQTGNAKDGLSELDVSGNRRRSHRVRQSEESCWGFPIQTEGSARAGCGPGGSPSLPHVRDLTAS